MLSSAGPQDTGGAKRWPQGVLNMVSARFNCGFHAQSNGVGFKERM